MFVSQICIHSLVHSRYIYSLVPLQVHYYSEALLTTKLVLCQSYQAEALQAIVSEGLAQGPYVAAEVRFEHATLWMQGTILTTEPPCLYVDFK